MGDWLKKHWLGFWRSGPENVYTFIWWGILGTILASVCYIGSLAISYLYPNASISEKWRDRYLTATVALAIPLVATLTARLTRRIRWRRAVRQKSGPDKPVRLRFENRDPFVVVTETTQIAISGDGLQIQQVKGPNRVYVRVFPECAQPVTNCTGYLLEICRKVGDDWARTDFNEAWPLTWANYGTHSVTIQPGIGPYLDVFFIAEDEKRISPCIRHEGAPLRMLNLQSPEVFKSVQEHFRFKVQMIGSEPVSDPIFLKARIGPHWERPIVELLPNEISE